MTDIKTGARLPVAVRSEAAPRGVSDSQRTANGAGCQPLKPELVDDITRR